MSVASSTNTTATATAAMPATTRRMRRRLRSLRRCRRSGGASALVWGSAMGSFAIAAVDSAKR